MRRGLNGFTRWPFRDVGDSVFYHSLSGLASGHSGRLAHTATIRPLGCSRKMRPLAFLDPSAFVGTNPTDEPITSALPVIRPE